MQQQWNLQLFMCHGHPSTSECLGCFAKQCFILMRVQLALLANKTLIGSILISDSAVARLLALRINCLQIISNWRVYPLLMKPGLCREEQMSAFLPPPRVPDLEYLQRRGLAYRSCRPRKESCLQMHLSVVLTIRARNASSATSKERSVDRYEACRAPDRQRGFHLPWSALWFPRENQTTVATIRILGVGLIISDC